MEGEPKNVNLIKNETMKLFKIQFNDLYVEAENEEQANEKLYDHLATISANDLETETLESSTDYLNLVDVINEKFESKITETDAWTNKARVAAGIPTVDTINEK